jgi:hypothetical protein
MVRRVAEVAVRVERLSGRRPSYVPTTENHDAGYPFFRLVDGTWCLLARERGRECFREETTSAHELLGWVASDLCRDVAQREELAHRVPGPDTRRAWFARWAELTRALDVAWGDAVDREIAGILARAPFRDAEDTSRS